MWSKNGALCAAAGSFATEGSECHNLWTFEEKIILNVRHFDNKE
jgi:hypothetical protein